MIVNNILSDILLSELRSADCASFQGNALGFSTLIKKSRSGDVWICVYLCLALKWHMRKKDIHTYMKRHGLLCLTYKVTQSEENNEYCMAWDVEPGKRGTFDGETRVFWPIPQHTLLQQYIANLHDSASERGRDGSDRVPVSLVFCSEPRVYIHSCTGSESLTTVAMVTAYFMHQSQRVSCDRKSNEGFFVFSASKNLLRY